MMVGSRARRGRGFGRDWEGVGQRVRGRCLAGNAKRKQFYVRKEGDLRI